MDIKGTGVALVTPFKEDYSVDYEALARLVDYQIDGGVEYIVVLGTTGEAVTLSEAERAEVIRFVAGHAAGRVPLVVGMSSNATAPLCRSLREADLRGYGAILSVVPYYNRPSQEGIYRHFKAVAEASPLPVVLYNVPSRTGTNMEAATTLRLAEEFPGKVIGVKEASGRIGQIRDIIERKPAGFRVVSGDDALCLPLAAMGAEGVISVIGNALPGSFSEMTRQAVSHNFDKAAAIDRSMQPLYRDIFLEGNPSGIKGLLNVMGLIGETLRLPLVPVSAATRALMADHLAQLPDSLRH
ncbi:MAG: 4-hydroxy-tetrahydrodipicolinate synthase [Alistipes timonensis]|nr:4-hydroxy-tetrahydrodipicolinate synthase [Alistipes timonensis]